VSYRTTRHGLLVPIDFAEEGAALPRPATDTAEIASIDRDITQALFGGRTLPNNDDTLRKRGGAKGLAIYDEIERDPHAFAVLQKRALAVVARALKIEPASESAPDQAAADLVRDALAGFAFDAACVQLLDATLKGFAVAEVMWKRDGDRLLPARLIGRDQRRFVFDADRQLRLLTRENPTSGEELPTAKFVVHSTGAKDGSPYGLGLGTRLFWPVWFKRQDLSFWLQFTDKFGSPTALGKYPQSASADEQAKLLKVLRAISHDAGVIVPEGMAIELIEASRSGSADAYEKLARYMDEQISECVLGETLTTNIGTVGSRAAADTHDGVRIEIAQADADLLADTLSQTLIAWIVAFNLPSAKPPRVTRDFDEEEDLNARAERDTKIAGLGFEPTERYILDTYGEGWVRKKAVTPPGGLFGFPAAADPATPDDESAFAEPAAARARNRAAQDTLGAAAAAAAADWERLLGPRVEALVGMLEESGDLVAFREQLARLLTGSPQTVIVEALARANFAAHLIGRGRDGTSA
jgi:phage gp29-like protein